MTDRIFPFSALVGQEKLKLALLLTAVAPQAGGVLMAGQKGTAKSTAVRALAPLLPPVRRVPGCPFGCARQGEFPGCPFCREHPDAVIIETPAPFVDLPLNATEDMLIGSLDISAAILTGRRAFQPGLLARAHRGILYIDEVNLLDDHLTQSILDAAASGWNTVEREGIRARHPAEFALAGTMNPEEGELRPQLKDRFAMCVAVSGEEDLERRVELMIRREDFDADPEGFCAKYAVEQQALADQVAGARRLYPSVTIAGHLRGGIARICMEANVAGHRAELALEAVSRAHAALRGGAAVTMKDILAVAELVLAHRRRDALPPPPPPESQEDERERNREEQPDPPREQDEPQDEQRDGEETETPDASSPQEQEPEQGPENSGESPPEQSGQSPDQSPGQPPEQAESGETREDDHVHDIGETFRVRAFAARKDARFRSGSGRRSRTRTDRRQGRYVTYARCADPKRCRDIAIDATLRAAAPYQRSRALDAASNTAPNAAIGNAKRAFILKPSDLHEKVREKKTGNALLFLVDASGSMGARGRMEASKGAVMSLLLDAYQKRDRTALIAFRRDGAEELLPFTSSVELAGKLLQHMPVGGKTPLAAGLEAARRALRRQLARDPDCRPIVFILTDGKANAALGGGNPLREALALAEYMARDRRVKYVVLDTEASGLVQLGLARQLAVKLDADYFTMENLKADTLLEVVRKSV